jgi:hypothetical protein
MSAGTLLCGRKGGTAHHDLRVATKHNEFKVTILEGAMSIKKEDLDCST